MSENAALPQTPCEPEPLTPHVHLNSLLLRNGQVITLSEGDIVLLVGPNNAGKSALLREIFAFVRDPASGMVVLNAANITKSGTTDDVVAWLTRQGLARAQGIPVGFVPMWWSGEALAGLGAAFFSVVDTESRLTAANPAGAVPFTTTAPSQPLHYLYLDGDLEERFSRMFRRAFGLDLIINRLGGSQIALHVGERPKLRSGEVAKTLHLPATSGRSSASHRFKPKETVSGALRDCC